VQQSSGHIKINKNCNKHIKTLCGGQSAWFCNVAADGIYSNHWALND
jgi:hypothetical protein